MPRSEKISFSVVDPESPSKALIAFEDLTVSPMPKHASRSQDVGKELCLKHRWEPAIDSLDSEQLQQILGFDGGDQDAEKQKIQLLDVASYNFIEEALKEVTRDQVDSHPHYISKLYRRMVTIRDSAVKTCLAHSMGLLDNFRSQSREEIREQFLSLGIEGEIVQEVGSNLPRILRQAISPSTLTQEIGDLYRHYEDSTCFKRSHARTAICVDKLAHQNPRLRMLEVGSGYTAVALAIIAILSGNNSTTTMTEFSSCEYTHPSNEVLEKAKENFQDCSSLISHRKLDIIRDIVKQGFELGGYDLVVASNSVNTFGDIEVNMKNIRTLIKHGGQLLLIEQTLPPLRGFPYETLRQWCQVDETSQEDRKYLSELDWNGIFQRTGFSGAAASFKVFVEDPEHCQSLMLASAVLS